MQRTKLIRYNMLRWAERVSDATHVSVKSILNADGTGSGQAGASHVLSLQDLLIYLTAKACEATDTEIARELERDPVSIHRSRNRFKKAMREKAWLQEVLFCVLDDLDIQEANKLAMQRVADAVQTLD